MRVGLVPGHCEQGNNALGRTVRGILNEPRNVQLHSTDCVTRS